MQLHVITIVISCSLSSACFCCVGMFKFSKLITKVFSQLMQTVLQQEGIAVPVKQRVSPRRRLLSDVSDKEEGERPSASQESDRHNESILFSEESHNQLSVTRPSQHQQQLPCTQTQGMMKQY